MGKRYNDLYDLAKFLKRELLPDVPVSVKRIKMPKDKWADCDTTKELDGFIIRLERKVSEQYALFFLMHEFAHCLSWDKQQKDHGISWGIAMSKVYCTFLRWSNSNDRQNKAACQGK